jgi:hypothetical protein
LPQHDPAIAADLDQADQRRLSGGIDHQLLTWQHCGNVSGRGEMHRLDRRDGLQALAWDERGIAGLGLPQQRQRLLVVTLVQRVQCLVVP